MFIFRFAALMIKFDYSTIEQYNGDSVIPSFQELVPILHDMIYKAKKLDALDDVKEALYGMGDGVSTIGYQVTASPASFNAVPAGWSLVKVIVVNNELHDVSVSLGTTLGGTDLLDVETVAAGARTTVRCGKLYSLTSNTSVYFSTPDVVFVGLTLIVETNKEQTT